MPDTMSVKSKASVIMNESRSGSSGLDADAGVGFSIDPTHILTRENLKLSVTMFTEPFSRSNPILVNHPQTPITIKLVVLIIGE